MKVLVTGGRDYNNRKEFRQILDIMDPTLIVHGAARGADTLASLYCKQFKIAEKSYPANWGLHGVRAGPLRNIQMLEENPDLDLVIAFEGGKGTHNMVTEAKTRGFNVHIVGDWYKKRKKSTKRGDK